VKLSTNQGAGVLYALPILAVVGAWVLLLVVHNPPPAKPFQVLVFILSEKPSLLWLQWFFAVPLLYLAMSTAYFTRVARNLAGSLVLLVLGAVAALACWITFDAWFATIVTIPLIASYQSVREIFTNPKA
jgi:hypothetical protein